jgi:hypothetical protein
MTKGRMEFVSFLMTHETDMPPTGLLFIGYPIAVSNQSFVSG